jgi:hypothetical protein
MAMLEPWRMRPPEEANLFNPPFICALSFEFLKSYSKDREDGASLFIIIVALTIALHAPSRQRLPYSTVTPLYAWVQENEDLLIGLATRAKNLTPYIREAVRFGMGVNAIRVTDSSNLGVGTVKGHFPKIFSDQTTSETQDIIERSRFLGRWLAKSGSEISISAALGVKP